MDSVCGVRAHAYIDLDYLIKKTIACARTHGTRVAILHPESTQNAAQAAIYNEVCMTLSNKFNDNQGLQMLVAFVTTLRDLVKTDLRQGTTTALEAIILRLCYELSGREEKPAMAAACKAVLRIPCGPALVSMTIKPLDLEIHYYPAHLANADPDEGNQGNWLLKVTRAGHVRFNSNAAMEFMRVLNACCSSGEDVIAGVTTYREMCSTNMDSRNHFSKFKWGGNSSNGFMGMNP